MLAAAIRCRRPPVVGGAAAVLRTAATSSVDPAEVAKFKKMSTEWYEQSKAIASHNMVFKLIINN